MKKPARLLSLILAILVLAGSAMCASAQTAPTQSAESEIGSSNWMSSIRSDVPITAINIPGTHDSATKYAVYSLFAKTQDDTILGQLYKGSRYFDIRYELKDDGTKLTAVHGIADCKKKYSPLAEDLTAPDILEMCETFLKDNPGETILYQLKQGDGDAGDALFDLFYEQCIKGHEDLWYLENRIPSLGEVRGKIVLLRVVSADPAKYNDTNSGINFSNYPHIPDKKTVINFKTCDIFKLSNGEVYSKLYIQDSYKLGGNKKWEAVTTYFDSEKDPNNFNLCLTSCIGLGIPLMNARVINHRLSLYDFEDGKYYGIIPMDHIDENISRNIYMTNSALMTETPNAQNTYSEKMEYAFLGRTLNVLRWIVFGITYGVSYIVNLFYR